MRLDPEGDIDDPIGAPQAVYQRVARRLAAVIHEPPERVAGMKIAIACDHRGYAVKQRIVAQILDRGHEVVDFGTDNPKPCDYPDYGIPAAKAVALGKADRGHS